jgi:hypothetical protein
VKAAIAAHPAMVPMVASAEPCSSRPRRVPPGNRARFCPASVWQFAGCAADAAVFPRPDPDPVARTGRAWNDHGRRR